MEAKYDRLAVLCRAANNARGKSQFLVQCDCGTSPPFVVLGDSLRRRKTKSCGCLRNELAAQRNRERAEMGRAA
jgi:hypothetical protein